MSVFCFGLSVNDQINTAGMLEAKAGTKLWKFKILYRHLRIAFCA